jgi:hypothetical protein
MASPEGRAIFFATHRMSLEKTLLKSSGQRQSDDEKYIVYQYT